MKNIILTDLLESKVYQKENGISFMPPKSLINPFLEAVVYHDEDLRIEVNNAIINENEDGTENIAYPRFLIEYKMSDVVFDGIQYQNVFGMLVAMDQQHPQIKVYSGMNVSACTNLSIFNAEELYVQNLNNDLTNVWNKVNAFYSNHQAKVNNYQEIHRKMTSINLTDFQLTHKLGDLLRNANKTRLGTSVVVNAAKLLDDKNSVYYAKDGCNVYNLYNAVTQGITDSKEILMKPDKTLALTKLLLN